VIHPVFAVDTASNINKGGNSFLGHAVYDIGRLIRFFDFFEARIGSPSMYITNVIVNNRILHPGVSSLLILPLQQLDVVLIDYW